jgi:hypothetical protein
MSSTVGFIFITRRLHLRSIANFLIIFTISTFCLSCATIVSGRSQSVGVATSPPGAHCSYERSGQVIGSVAYTPGAIYLDKTKHAIVLSCSKEGYEDSSATIDSGIDTAVWGNLILGGIPGWIIDSIVGADNHYNETTLVSLKPKENNTKLSVASTTLNDANSINDTSLFGTQNSNSYNIDESDGVVSEASSLEKQFEKLRFLKESNVISLIEYNALKDRIISKELHSKEQISSQTQSLSFMPSTTDGLLDKSSRAYIPNNAVYGNQVHVRPYYRKDGTYVRGHTRSYPSR